ncbi:hypothetical protein [uncultured Nostoc sp.]|uniref:hypothetical protein n=1 Tax=uncultured Nostoc sp. TaxID=340711 RepID=UPI00262F532B|nr:hypothetical protein [uncultured Nostoc sp.]
MQALTKDYGAWWWEVFAVRTTSPFSFSAKPVASTMRSGVVVVILLATNERSLAVIIAWIESNQT